MNENVNALLQSQREYYRQRAKEYDRTYVPYMAPAAPALRARLARGGIRGEVLELASGTGFWTQILVGMAAQVTALDGSPEMIELARARDLPRATYERADLFTWQPDRQWDHVFFAHWLAHVPDERLAPFWDAVGRALRPHGTVQFIDVTPLERRIESGDVDARPDVVTRSLSDGRSFRIIKAFREVAELEERLRSLNWRTEIEEVHPGFIYGVARPAGS